MSNNFSLRTLSNQFPSTQLKILVGIEVTIIVEVYTCFTIFYLQFAIGSFTMKLMLKQATDLRNTKLLVFKKPQNTSHLL